MQIQLATELSTATAQMSTLQLELVELRKREGELKQQLQTSNSLNVSTREELDKLRLQRDGKNSEEIWRLWKNLRCAREEATREDTGMWGTGRPLMLQLCQRNTVQKSMANY